MEPIQLQCGSCGQMMGISPEHLGSQVQCPHCQAVVQTPPPSPNLAQAPAPAPQSIPQVQVGETESIFSAPEPTDDLFGGDAAPKIQMPHLETLPKPAPVSTTAATVTMEPAAPVYEQMATEPSAAPFLGNADAADEPLSSFTPRRAVPQGGNFMMILLVFLVPYAICTTGFIGYLLYTWPKDNPLKNLPDIGPKGQPRLQVKHDLPLDRDMKTALGAPIRVGAIEVTPLRVKYTSERDLVLVFKAKNLTTDHVFNPISDDYLKFRKQSMDSGRPYTFLERISKDNLNKLYGGNLEYFKMVSGREKEFEGDIGPGEEAIVHLTSDLQYREREVPNVLKASERLVWRVQVRRGLVPVDGKMISATTVIGIEFTARDIVKEKERNDG